MTDTIDRRSFILQGSAAALGLSTLGEFSPPRDPAQGNDRIVAAVMGVNSRGNELAQAFVRTGAEVRYICDVDSRAVERTVAQVDQLQQETPRGVTDFRRALDDPAVDALVIAAPDHWHAPATLLALQAGKHVYVEKPCSHNPREGELLVEAQQRYGRVVQMGNQQRSSPQSIGVIQQIREGVIGRPYYGRAWYGNTRGSIGHGAPAPVPEWLDYELWQGPAPRTPYRDNVVHYNWHWFWIWGTGEICNNGTHEIDVCRWALGVEFPTKATSAGGRYHFDDDWECPDTQIASFEFENGATITWEGRSCNGRPIENRGRGASIHGTDGTVIIDRSGYVIYDNENNEIARHIRGETVDALDTRGAGTLTDLHIANFLESIRGEASPTAPIDEGHKSQLLCHLGNIAQRSDGALTCDPQTGRILADADAERLWSREYEPGWEPKV
ncbi:MAG: Gfo/Idh/MocA family oxidoreductase [Gemmatimonadota bacterium]|nr:MAG: Gfo/Idh/MocA family oxidoreductase [Gemmatimonadota bacterium]